MKPHIVIPAAILAALLCASCTTPKSDGTAKHDGAATTQAPPTTATTASNTDQTAPAPSTGVHVADVIDVTGSLGADAKTAPNFSWKGADGQTHSLKEYNGKVVLLNFWGTWCPPCRAELPDIVKLRNELHSGGFEVIGLGVGEQARNGKAPADNVADFAEKNGLNYPLLLANQELAEAYGGIEAVPTTFIVDAKGNVVDKMIGMQSETALRAAIKKAM